ncbi:phospholipid-binding protein ybcl [Flammeovirgaceae bacterium 311]|nr:phospholipid-binding protein ybcl [Flammeovirgaceae bacterium 311]
MKKILYLPMLLLFSHGVIAQTFTLKSRDIGGQATADQVYNGFGCSGANISPQLSWENVPAGTKSFAVTMYDQDAPTGSGWWHWVMFNLPAGTRELSANAGNPELPIAPKGSIQSLTDFGRPGYGGPCPPEGQGVYTYILTVYALNTEKLELDEEANPALVGFNLNANTIQKASLVLYYGR